jgi:PAS domain S-box-containing protein
MARPNREAYSLHLAKVVEASDDAIVSKNLDGIILSWNPAAARIFGYHADEVVGRSIRLLIPDDLQAEDDQVRTVRLPLVSSPVA